VVTLTTVILATQEVEIRRFMALVQPRQKVSETPSPPSQQISQACWDISIVLAT
jgi:hypothetical protein